MSYTDRKRDSRSVYGPLHMRVSPIGFGEHMANFSWGTEEQRQIYLLGGTEGNNTELKKF